VTGRRQTLTVYLQVGENGNSYWSRPRLVKASTRASVKTEPDTVGIIRLDLLLPESVFVAARPEHTIRVEIDESKVALVEVSQEPAE
jgi:hypothetical protein